MVGARCAGAPTAMLLARAGYHVLLTDRASFPSDALSTHALKLAACAHLKRWGLLDRVAATNAPPIGQWTLDVGPFALTGKATPLDDVGEISCVRRTRLDAILVEAATEAGAELRERFAVRDLLWEDGRVVGVRGQTAGGATVEWPNAEFAAVRADVEGQFARAVKLAPALAERFRAGRREEPFAGTADLPNFFRRPFGPGWALVGDAGSHKDPITAQGITDAFRDAQLLADAVDEGLSGRRPLDDALAAYEQRRNEIAIPIYEFICQQATLAPPPPEIAALLAGLRGNQEQTDRLFGMIENSVPVAELFSPENVGRIMARAGAA